MSSCDEDDTMETDDTMGTVYKCDFCSVIFERMEGILRHNKYYCHKRNKLPRSSTITISMLHAAAVASGLLLMPHISSDSPTKEEASSKPDPQENVTNGSESPEATEVSPDESSSSRNLEARLEKMESLEESTTKRRKLSDEKEQDANADASPDKN